MKLRQWGELLAQQVATRAGSSAPAAESQVDLLRRLGERGLLPREVAQLFHEVRRAGNSAAREFSGDSRAALAALQRCRQLGLWFHRTFADPEFDPGPFVPPPPAPAAAEARRRAELEAAFEAERAAFAARLAALRAEAQAAPRARLEHLGRSADRAAWSLQLDESATRERIDEQLRAAGWEADSSRLTHGRGARPEKGRNLAIAEWPTASGPADYVLFAGRVPLAAVEAKREAIDVSERIPQAARYSGGFAVEPEMAPPGAELLIRGYRRAVVKEAGRWATSRRYRSPQSRLRAESPEWAPARIRTGGAAAGRANGA